MKPPLNLIWARTSRCNVPAREATDGTVVLLNAARKPHRAIPGGFMAREQSLKKQETSLKLPPFSLLQPPTTFMRWRPIRRRLTLFSDPQLRAH
jgi:hypothetical protein